MKSKIKIHIFDEDNQKHVYRRYYRDELFLEVLAKKGIIKEDSDEFEEGIKEKYKFSCSSDSHTDFLSYLRSLTDEDLEKMKKITQRGIMKKYIVEDGFTKSREGYICYLLDDNLSDYWYNN